MTDQPEMPENRLTPGQLQALRNFSRDRNGGVEQQNAATAPQRSSLKLILPCPFCGGLAAIEEVGDGASVRFSVGCKTDGDETDICMGYQSLTTFNRRSDAIDAWNKRPDDEWAKKWHETCEVMMTVAGLSSSGSPREMLAEFQAWAAQCENTKNAQSNFLLQTTPKQT